MLKNWDFLIAEVWAHLLIAVVLTLLMSWFIWGYLRGKENRLKLQALQSDLSAAREQVDVKEAELVYAGKDREQLQQRIAGVQTKLSHALQSKTVLKETLEDTRKKLTETEQSEQALRQKLAALTAARSNGTTATGSEARPIGNTAYDKIRHLVRNTSNKISANVTNLSSRYLSKGDD